MHCLYYGIHKSIYAMKMESICLNAHLDIYNGFNWLKIIVKPVGNTSWYKI